MNQKHADMDMICQEIRQLTAERNEQLCENKGFVNAIATTKEELGVLCEGIANMKEEAACLKRELCKSNKKAFEEEFKRVNCEIEKRQSDITQLRKKNNQLEVCAAGFQEEICSAKGHIKALENAICNYEDRLHNAEACVDQMHYQNKAKEQEIQEINCNLLNTKRCLEKQSAELREKCYQVDCMTENLQNLTCSVQAYTEKVKDRQRTLNELDNNHNKVQGKIQHESRVSQKLEGEICHARNVTCENQCQLKFYETELCHLKQKRAGFLREIREEICKLKRGEEGCLRQQKKDHSKPKKYELESFLKCDQYCAVTSCPTRQTKISKANKSSDRYQLPTKMLY